MGCASAGSDVGLVEKMTMNPQENVIELLKLLENL
jgi:hypothetical protein